MPDFRFILIALSRCCCCYYYWCYCYRFVVVLLLFTPLYELRCCYVAVSTCRAVDRCSGSYSCDFPCCWRLPLSFTWLLPVNLQCFKSAWYEIANSLAPIIDRYDLDPTPLHVLITYHLCFSLPPLHNKGLIFRRNIWLTCVARWRNFDNRKLSILAFSAKLDKSSCESSPSSGNISKWHTMKNTILTEYLPFYTGVSSTGCSTTWICKIL